VFDVVDLPNTFRDGPPTKDHPLYYYRPWKTILCRTIADGGKSYYFQGDHQQTIPTLWHELVKKTKSVTESVGDSRSYAYRRAHLMS
jgi:hypothetical protein